jgi:hypothetical protein
LFHSYCCTGRSRSEARLAPRSPRAMMTVLWCPTGSPNNPTRRRRSPLDAPGLSGGGSRSSLHPACPVSLPFLHGCAAAAGKKGERRRRLLVAPNVTIPRASRGHSTLSPLSAARARRPASSPALNPPPQPPHQGIDLRQQLQSLGIQTLHTPTIADARRGARGCPRGMGSRPGPRGATANGRLPANSRRRFRPRAAPRERQ